MNNMSRDLRTIAEKNMIRLLFAYRSNSISLEVYNRLARKELIISNQFVSTINKLDYDKISYHKKFL